MLLRIGPGTPWIEGVNIINNNSRRITSLLQYVEQPTDWILPTFTNSWVNYGGGWSDAGYYRDAVGVVHLRGLIKSGTVAQSAFTLPEGFRPASQLLIGTISNNAIGRVRVNTSGTVVPESPSSNVYVALDGITFKAEQ